MSAIPKDAVQRKELLNKQLKRFPKLFGKLFFKLT